MYTTGWFESTGNAAWPIAHRSMPVCRCSSTDVALLTHDFDNINCCIATYCPPVVVVDGICPLLPYWNWARWCCRAKSRDLNTVQPSKKHPKWHKKILIVETRDNGYVMMCTVRSIVSYVRMIMCISQYAQIHDDFSSTSHRMNFSFLFLFYFYFAYTNRK